MKTTAIPRHPRLGEAVYFWTGNSLEAGRIIHIEADRTPEMERFQIHLIDSSLIAVCGRGDFALLPELRNLIPHMRQAINA